VYLNILTAQDLAGRHSSSCLINIGEFFIFISMCSIDENYITSKETAVGN